VFDPVGLLDGGDTGESHGRRRSHRQVLPIPVCGWGVERGWCGAAGGGVQTSCWVLKQPAPLWCGGWFSGSLPVVDTVVCGDDGSGLIKR
jgi:hypothetical protein